MSKRTKSLQTIKSRNELLSFLGFHVIELGPTKMLAIIAWGRYILIGKLSQGSEKRQAKWRDRPAIVLLAVFYKKQSSEGLKMALSDGAIKFLKEVRKRVSNPGPVMETAYEVALKSALCVLGLNESDLWISLEDEQRWLVSSPKFERRFEVKVRIPVKTKRFHLKSTVEDDEELE